MTAPKGLKKADGETRERVARAGGQASAAAMTAERRADRARTAAAAAHQPAALARRIVKAWPELDKDERAEVISILALLNRHRPSDADAPAHAPIEPTDNLVDQELPLT